MVAILILLYTCSSALNISISLLPPTGYPPLSTSFASMASISSSLYIFGGKDLFSYSNSIYEFNLSTFIWAEIKPGSQFQPSPRINSVFFSYESNLYLYGGLTEDGQNSDLWLFNVSTARWTILDQYGDLPSARSQMGFCLDDDNLYVFGGITNQGMDSSLYRL